MKKKILALLTLVFCGCAFAEYQYNGKTISDKQFEKMYAENKDRLFVDNTGSVYSVQVQNPCCPGIGDAFFLNVELNKTLDDNGIAIAQGEYRGSNCTKAKEILRKMGLTSTDKKSLESHYQLMYVLNPDFSTLKMNKVNRIPVLMVKHYGTDGKGVEQLQPFTKEKFASYLRNHLLPEATTTAVEQENKQVPCPKCYGSGTITPKRKRIDCPNCNGTGRVTE